MQCQAGGLSCALLRRTAKRCDECAGSPYRIRDDQPGKSFAQRSIISELIWDFFPLRPNANQNVKDTSRMSIDAAHKSWWQIFEVIFGIPFLVAIALQFISPLSLPRGLPRLFLIPVGAVIIIAGTILAILARREFAQQGQPTDPGHPTSRVVTAGVFSISRNPLYLGGICLLVGIALSLDLPWVLVLLLPSLVGCHYILIAPEERYLETKFGEEYRRYAASVHRWLGRS
jgi:protein-S-isoprenylcysteine O-methyltransferase Ste14